MRPCRAALAGILALTLGAGALAAWEPVVLKSIFDGLTGVTSGPLAKGLLVLAAIGLVRETVSGVSNWLTWRMRLRIHYSLLEATVSRLHKLPVAFHRAEAVGAVMTRLDRGIQGFVGAITDISFQVLPAVVYLVVSVVLMLRMNWKLALVVLVFAPLPAVIAAWAAPSQVRRERLLLNRWAHIYSRFNEVLSGIVTVKSFTMEDEEKQRFLGGVDEANAVVARGVGFDAGVGAGQNLLVTFARLAALAGGALLVRRGEISAGTLVAFLGYAGGLFAPVQGLTGVYRTLRTAGVSVDAVFDILDAQDLLGDAPDARELSHVRGDVRFQRVRFRYGQGDTASPMVLDGIDLHAHPGEVVAIVGPSGSGKSTLMALLQRLYDPTDGAVRIDGVDLRDVKQRSLRRHIGVVLQDALLFNETIRENIAYGRPNASRHDIESAARAACAHDFIMKLPDGYDSVVGERGGRLSGGERQRIAIARALLKDPPIVILDEATSALDAESEALVQEALAHLLAGRTTFIVAHRLSTVVRADRIVVLRDGRIQESGTHRELMSAGGYYAHLVRRLTGGLLATDAAA